MPAFKIVPSRRFERDRSHRNFDVTPLVIPEGQGSLTRRIASGLKTAVHSGRLRLGSRAPSTRSLARSLGVSRNVIINAYEELAAEGYFIPRGGAGTFIAAAPPTICRVSPPQEDASDADPRPSPARLSQFGQCAVSLAAHERFRDASPPVEIDFAYWRGGADTQAEREWARLLRQRLQRPPADYPPPLGAPALREAIAKHVMPLRGIETSPDDVIVVSGAQQGIELVVRALVNSGDTVVVEEPHYQGTRQSLLAAGAHIRYAPVDRSGLNLRAMQPHGCKAVFTTPSRQFPTGVAMPFSRRLELLRWCAESDAWLVEDDFDSEFHYDGRQHAAIKAMDQTGRVFYIGTFVRSISLATFS